MHVEKKQTIIRILILLFYPLLRYVLYKGCLARILIPILDRRYHKKIYELVDEKD